MPEQVGMGVIGCGGIGSYHAEAFSRLPGARLVAVADSREESARGVAERLSCGWHADYRELLARRDVDAVSVCTPSGLHAGVGIAAARAAKHVLVEKPLDIDLTRADRLIATCSEMGVQLGGVFQHRFNRAAHRVKAALDQGAFGNVFLGSVDVKWHRPQSYYDSGGGWRGSRALDGGVLANQGIHFIDQLCWFLGDVERVLFVDLDRVGRNIECEDLATVVVQFASGARGVIQATTATYPGTPGRIELCGDRGMATLLTDVLGFFQVESESAAVNQVESAPLGPNGEPTYGHEALFLDFVAAVREGRPPLIDGREARRAVHALTLIYDAACSAASAPESRNGQQQPISSL